VLEFGDDISMFQVSVSLLERRQVSVVPETPGTMEGADGRHYSKYGPALPFVAVPFLAAGKVLSLVVPPPPARWPNGLPVASAEVLIACLASALATSGAAALVHATTLRLGGGWTAALVAGLGLALTTPAWHYGRTFMTEPFSLLAFSALLHGTAVLGEPNGRPMPIWSLSAATLALPLLRPVSAVFLPIVVAAALLAACAGGRSRRDLLRLFGAFATSAVLGVGFVMLYNFLRFGSPLETGYPPGETFRTPLLVGVRGLLASSGKSVFLYAPVLALAIPGCVVLWRRSRAVAALVFGLFAAHVVIYARWSSWWGGGCWGPRFLVPTMGGLMVAAALWGESRPSVGRRVLLMVVLAASFLVQVSSVLVSYIPYQAKMEASKELFSSLLWSWPDTPVWAQLHALFVERPLLDLAFRHYGWRGLLGIQLSAAAGFVLLASVAIVRGWRGASRPG
jgi:hypothetical protein